ncbi:MAG: outer membrane protein assembly factor BamB [Motiliproteus sp.]
MTLFKPALLKGLSLNRTLLNRTLPLALILSLTGCGLWDTDEEIEPADLVDITEEYDLDKLWSVQIGAGSGEKYLQLTPAFTEKQVFAVDHEGEVYAIDRQSGDTQWRQELELSVSGGVGAGEGVVVATSFDGRAVALNSNDGELLWQVDLTSEAVAPAQLTYGLALIQTIDGRLSAFDVSNGQLRWSYSAQEPALTLRGTSTPLVVGDTVFAGFSSGKVVALKLRTGDVQWESRITAPEGRTELERMVDIDGSLLQADGLIYAGSYQGKVAAIVMRDGRRLWSEPLSSYRSLAQGGQSLFAVDDQGSLVAFDKRSGTELWKQDALYYREVSAPAVIDGLVAVGDYDGYIHLVNPGDGNFVGRHRVDSSAIVVQPISRNGVLYTFSNDGRLSALVVEQE